MKTQSVFTERLLTDGYARSAQCICIAIPLDADTERTPIGAPFNILINYEVEPFAVGLPMYTVDANDKILIPCAFHYDHEQRIQAHLYRLDNSDYLVVQRCSDGNSRVYYIAELYTQNNTK